MVIGVVVGSVVASQKTENMEAVRLRVVRRLSPEGKPSDSYVVAVDTLGAANGEYVLVASGSTARQTTATDNKPIDAIIIAIIDTWQLRSRVVYDKASVEAPP